MCGVGSPAHNVGKPRGLATAVTAEFMKRPLHLVPQEELTPKMILFFDGCPFNP